MKGARRDYETIDFPFEVKSLNDVGELEGYAAVFGNEDKGGDIIEPGAFTKTIQENAAGVPILYQHDVFEPIGLSTKLEEDRHGLLVKGQLNMDVQRARETRSLLNQGAMKGLSIGYKTVKQARVGGVRRLKELGLKEFSPVTFPMNELAVASVKADSDVIWDPDSTLAALQTAVRMALNPTGRYTYWVRDISAAGDSALVSSYDDDDTEAWVVPFTVDTDGAVTVSPSTDWTTAEQVWVADTDDIGKTELVLTQFRAFTLAAIRESKAGRMFSAANLTSLQQAHEKISALLELAKPAPATSEDDEAAGKAAEPALATLRQIATQMRREVKPA